MAILQKAVTAMATDISLDFANTAEWHAGPNPEERLTSYGKAVEWAQRVGILTDAQAQSLFVRAGTHPGKQADALLRIIALREAVYRIFSAVAHDRPPSCTDLEILNTELGPALAHLRLVPAADSGQETAVLTGAAEPRRFAWSWSGVEDDLTSLLWPVARAASSLLSSPELARVRECADDTCGWLFLDISRNASRRWCDMADCGNRAKARRYRERKKG
jgi:predicted RNA-binding Zn ribbon-like protein